MKWRNETYLPVRTSLPERQAMTTTLVGRCSYCGHIRTLDKGGMMCPHHYLGSAVCEGSGKAPSSPAETTGADSGPELRPCDSSVPASCVEAHRLYCAEVDRMHQVAAERTVRHQDVVEEFHRRERTQDTIRQRLTDERDEARRDRDWFAQTIEFRVKELDVARAVVAERDATIERLWCELNEATNVPDAPTSYREAVQRCGGVQAADDRRSL